VSLPSPKPPNRLELNLEICINKQDINLLWLTKRKKSECLSSGTMLSLIRADYTSHEHEVILKYGVCQFLTFCARVYCICAEMVYAYVI